MGQGGRDNRNMVDHGVGDPLGSRLGQSASFSLFIDDSVRLLRGIRHRFIHSCRGAVAVNLMFIFFVPDYFYREFSPAVDYQGV